MIDRRRLATYLDEVSDDPEEACRVLKGHGLSLVVLRRAWATPVCLLADPALHQLREILKSYGMRTLLIASDLGSVPPDQLDRVAKPEFDRPFLLASYFGASQVRVHAGYGRSRFNPEPVQDWAARVTAAAVAANVTPLLEVNPESYPQEAADVALFLGVARRWKLLYDPGQLVMRRAVDPFIRYWSLLKSRVGVIELHDMVTGRGPAAVGQGGAGLDATLRDATAGAYDGHWTLEPGLGCRYGQATTRAAVFETALDAIRKYF